MSRREAIRMTDAELATFIEEARVLTCATIGAGGRPHLMPLWFCVRDGQIASWTYASSQKARNLERSPQATIQLEAGETYDQLRGVMQECDVEILRDLDAVTAVGLGVALRYAPGVLPADDPPAELRAFVAQQAAKRIGLIFHPTRTVTWDHRKLGGIY
jgi:Pyridoxamine 5'-phosphate oxidase